MSQGVFSSITRMGTLEPFDLQVARGQITAHSLVTIFGYQANISNVSYTVWEQVAPYNFPTSASLCNVVSNSASDNSTHKVTINGLDANFAPISETITLNGTSNVTTTKSYLRINSAFFIDASGSAPLTPNAGTITIKQNSTNNVIAQMNSNIGRTEAAIYTVPAGYTFYLTRASAFTYLAGGGAGQGTNDYSNYQVKAVNNATGTVFFTLQSPFAPNYLITRVVPFPYTEKTDLSWQIYHGDSNVGPAGVNVEGILIKNDSQN